MDTRREECELSKTQILFVDGEQGIATIRQRDRFCWSWWVWDWEEVRVRCRFRWFIEEVWW